MRPAFAPFSTEPERKPTISWLRLMPRVSASRAARRGGFAACEARDDRCVPCRPLGHEPTRQQGSLHSERSAGAGCQTDAAGACPSGSRRARISRSRRAGPARRAPGQAHQPADLGLAEVAEVSERDDAPLPAVEGVRRRGDHRTCEAQLVDRLVERDRSVEVERQWLRAAAARAASCWILRGIRTTAHRSRRCRRISPRRSARYRPSD